MRHYRRRWWLIVQGSEPLLDPSGEGLIDPVADAAELLLSLPGILTVGIEPESVHLGPALGERKPLLVDGPLLWNRLLDGLDQTFQPSLAVGLGLRFDAGDHPRVAQPVCLRVRDLLEQTFKEEVVDVDANIVVIEGDLRRPWELHAVGLYRFAYRIGSKRLPIEEDGPSLLEEPEERLPVSDDPLKRPLAERAALTKELDEVGVQNRRNAEAAVVASQQEPDEIGLLPDRLRSDPEDVAQYESFGLPVTQRPVGLLPLLSLVEVVEVASVQGVDDWIAQVWEQLTQVERKLTARLEEVVRQRARSEAAALSTTTKSVSSPPSQRDRYRDS